METRKLYKQGKSTVLVIPPKYLKALKWAAQDEVTIVLQCNMSLNLSREKAQVDLLKSPHQTPEPKKEAPNVDH